MPLNRIVNAMNKFIEHAESGQLKEAAKAINEANSAYREIDQKPESRKKTKEILGEIYEKLKGGDREDAIEQAVEFRGNFEGALQMQEQMRSQIQVMKNAGIDPVQMAKNMPAFQVLVGSLCFRFYKPHVPPNILGLFGMLEALEEGLNGNCDGKTVKEVLESVKNYKNDFYISPTKFIGDPKEFMENFPFIYKGRNIKSSLKEFLATFIHWQLTDKLKESGITLDLENPDCFEGVLAVSLEFGLLYHLSDSKAAIKLAREHRPSTPY